MALEKLTMPAMREMTDVELRAKIAEFERERFTLRFKAASEVLRNPMDLKTARRTVARLKTVLAERAAKATRA